MSTVFEGKVRRLGNSMVVIIPKKILDETGAKEGDVLKLALPVSKQKRKEAFKKMAGIATGSEAFERDKRDSV
jgi:antitoxin component of MazEF toxin-antitoxin module